MKVEIRQMRNLDLDSAEPAQLSDLRQALAKFAERKATIDRGAPGLNERAFERARSIGTRMPVEDPMDRYVGQLEISRGVGVSRAVVHGEVKAAKESVCP
ncbi:hypothetical protein ACFWM1_17170 [Nocardia sp. NPDC058379]|uniref:hypothetical protein n=1 Tax=unclassified Nocardia TaxID=2637762 RepID=UPI003649791E